MAVIIETSIGNFLVDLYTEERPRCSFNFLKLCKLKYFNYCLFHSIQPGLIAQTGDPTRTGNGGESIYYYTKREKYFQNEPLPKIKHRKPGLISMVNNGNHLHGSQFFITLGNNLQSLDQDKHTVFGEITEGLDIIKSFNKAHIGRDNVPLRDIRIFHTIVIYDSYPEPRNLSYPEKSPDPTDEEAKPLRIGCDEIVEDDDVTVEVKEEIMKIEEEKVNTQILTIIGDLPSEDSRPPENVLFVCNLNPITKDEDLEVIFSRFGEIVSCEVIRDPKTGNSLQYAFIEFEDIKGCEKAYFEMERVLIDDRRIHVDFSQSVSKQRKEMLRNQRREKFRRDGGSSTSHKRKRSGSNSSKHKKHKDKKSNKKHDRYRSRSRERQKY